MRFKTCSKCKRNLEKNNFSKNKCAKDGLQCHCKDCEAKSWKKYSAKPGFNKKKAEYAKQYRAKLENKEKIRLYFKRYGARPSVIKRRNEHIKKRNLIDIQFKLSTLLRIRLCKAIKRNQKSGSAVKDLGCSISDLKLYLEKQFIKGMSWENHGEWHIDHKIPLKHFDLTDRNQLLRAVHYTNLQPLWARDNIAKQDKILEEYLT